MKVLIVDDSKVMRKLVTKAVSVLGFDSVEASNGVEALDILGKSSPDFGLMTLDLNMPEMDGFTLLDRVKADERFRDIPVMIITSESERASVFRAIKAGAKNYITKPFTQEDLTTKIIESLGMGM